MDDDPDNDNDIDSAMIPDLYQTIVKSCWDACAEDGGNVFNVMWTGAAALAGFLVMIGEYNKVDRDKVCSMWRSLCRSHEESMRTFRPSAPTAAAIRKFDA